MSDPRIAELDKEQEILKMHLTNHGNLLTSLKDSTKELHDSVREQQITIIQQSHTISDAVNKMTVAMERQEAVYKDVNQVKEYISDVDVRLLKVEEKEKSRDEFWKPVKSRLIMAVTGFFAAGVIWASVTAFKG